MQSLTYQDRDKTAFAIPFAVCIVAFDAVRQRYSCGMDAVWMRYGGIFRELKLPDGSNGPVVNPGGGGWGNIKI